MEFRERIYDRSLNPQDLLDQSARAIRLRTRFVALCRAENYDEANRILGHYLGENLPYLSNISLALAALDQLTPVWKLDEIRWVRPHYRVRFKYTGLGNPGNKNPWSRWVNGSAEAVIIGFALKQHTSYLSSRMDELKKVLDESNQGQ